MLGCQLSSVQPCIRLSDEEVCLSVASSPGEHLYILHTDARLRLLVQLQTLSTSALCQWGHHRRCLLVLAFLQVFCICHSAELKSTAMLECQSVPLHE